MEKQRKKPDLEIRARILAYVTANPGCTSQDIVDSLGLSTRSIAGIHLQRMSLENLIESDKTSSKRNLRWSVATVKPPKPVRQPLIGAHGRDVLVAALFGVPRGGNAA